MAVKMGTMAATPKRVGYRTVRHMGARRINADTTVALAVIPVFAGERVTSLHLDGVTVQRNDDGWDQLAEVNWYGIFEPFRWASIEASGVGDWDLVLRRSAAQTVSGHPWGGEPNTGGSSTEWMALTDLQPGLMFFIRETFMRPQAAVVDTQAVPLPSNTQGRAMDEFKTTVRRGLDIQTDGALIIGVHRGTVAAQTTFGADEIDVSATPVTRLQALTTPGETTDGPTARFAEVMYGGDTYIEADTLKAHQATGFLKAIARVHTPWPLTPQR